VASRLLLLLLLRRLAAPPPPRGNCAGSVPYHHSSDGDGLSHIKALAVRPVRQPARPCLRRLHGIHTQPQTHGPSNLEGRVGSGAL